MTSHTVVHDFTRPMPPAHPSDLQGRLREIGKGIPGRLSMTINSDEDAVYILHWAPPGPSSFGDCKVVCRRGAVEDALQMAREYVEGWR